MSKSAEAFRTISEVADVLDTPAHVLRFWESRFSQIKPVKRAGGRRYYRPSDVALLGGIKHLLHESGLTIRGVQKLLREQGVRHVASFSGLDGAHEDLAAHADGPVDIAPTAQVTELEAEPQAAPEPAPSPLTSPAPANWPAAPTPEAAPAGHKLMPDPDDSILLPLFDRPARAPVQTPTATTAAPPVATRVIPPVAARLRALGPEDTLKHTDLLKRVHQRLSDLHRRRSAAGHTSTD